MRETHGERGAHNRGLGRSPQRGPGQSPLVRESGVQLPEAERFSALECPKEEAFFSFPSGLGLGH